MRLFSQGDPLLLKAMGVEGAVLRCTLTPESIGTLGEQAKRVRDCGLSCEVLMPDWDLVEKTIENPDLLKDVMVLFDEMSKLGATDLLISCGMKDLDALSEAGRRTYETRFVKHLGQMYDRAQELNLHVCLHTSLKPGIYLEDAAAVDRWLSDFPAQPNSLLLCVGCTESAGLNTLELTDKWLKRIRAVHVRNVVGRYEDKSAKDVRVDSGTLSLPQVFGKLSAVGFQGPIIPEHFPEFPCENGKVVSQGFSLGYCRALIQARRPKETA